MRARQKQAPELKIDRRHVYADSAGQAERRDRSARTWAALIQRVYEVDPLKCPDCGAPMRIISFIETRQSDVVERILRHLGLWEGPLRTLPKVRAPSMSAANRANSEPRDLQLVLDPEYL